jgi:hypothetical protein
MGILIEMALRILFECRLSAARSLDLGFGNLALLGQAMCKDDCVLAVKEIQNLVDVTLPNP